MSIWKEQLTGNFHFALSGDKQQPCHRQQQGEERAPHCYRHTLPSNSLLQTPSCVEGCAEFSLVRTLAAADTWPLPPAPFLFLVFDQQLHKVETTLKPKNKKSGVQAEINIPGKIGVFSL